MARLWDPEPQVIRVIGDPVRNGRPADRGDARNRPLRAA